MRNRIPQSREGVFNHKTTSGRFRAIASRLLGDSGLSGRVGRRITRRVRSPTVSSREWYIPSWTRGPPGDISRKSFSAPPTAASWKPRAFSSHLPPRESLWHYRDSEGTWSVAISPRFSLFIPPPSLFSLPLSLCRLILFPHRSGLIQRRCLLSSFAICPFLPYPFHPLFRVRSGQPRRAGKWGGRMGKRRGSLGAGQFNRGQMR